MRRIRTAFLLVVLAVVALTTWQTRTRSTDWDLPLYVAIHPIAGDDTPRTAAYLAAIERDAFAGIDEFLAREGARHGLAIRKPVSTRVARVVEENPPLPPREGGPLAIAWWSLKLRYWANGIEDDGPTPDIKIFAVHFDPDRQPVLAHSLGLQKGLIGVVNLFADDDMAGSNTVVIVHELLHTLGATDKYDPRSNLPAHPHGFAEPNREPLYPQDRAEIMAGRVAMTPNEARTPDHLDEVVVGPLTAAEINWVR